MNHYAITVICIFIVLFSSPLFFSCKDSIVDPKGVSGPLDERILFIKYDDRITDICSIKPDGTDLGTIASHDMAGEYLYEGYFQARWSPDGDKVTFNFVKKLEGFSKYARGSDLFVLDINSGAVEQLTNFAADSFHVYVQDWK